MQFLSFFFDETIDENSPRDELKIKRMTKILNFLKIIFERRSKKSKVMD